MKMAELLAACFPGLRRILLEPVAVPVHPVHSSVELHRQRLTTLRAAGGVQARMGLSTTCS